MVTRLRVELVEQGARKAFEPDGDTVRIGRAPDADVPVRAADVALLCARIHVRDDRAMLENVGAEPALRVRREGSVLSLAVDAREPLASGDVVLLGGEGEPAAELHVRLDSDAAPPRIFELRPLSELPGGEKPRVAGDGTLRTLCEVQRRIGAAPDLRGVLSAVADGVLALVPRATHATVVLRDEAAGADDGDGFVPVLTRVRGAPGQSSESSGQPVRVTRSVFRKVVRDRAAVLAADAPEGELVSESLLGASIRSTIGVPLWKGDEILGVLQLDNRAAPAMFASADVESVAALAAIASLAVANTRLIERLRLVEEQLDRENRFLKGRDRARRGSAEIVGQSKPMLELGVQISKVANTRVSVLIEGETGSGKELVAAAVHYRSNRQSRLFVAQNCAALPENLLESELFGHKRGAFTGATEDRKGLFEVADGGTLFLDEVTEMPLSLQAKLLRALQEGEVRPLGATQTKHVDVRIVAATNRHIENEVKAGRFREDLYYRLKVFPLTVPALRERPGDVPLLAGHFLGKYAAEMGKTVAGFAQEAMELLMSYDWPGNVRQLENEIQRLVIQVEPGAFVTPELLSPRIREVEGAVASAGVTKGTLREMMDQVERHFLSLALKEHGNNKTSAAKALGITREGLHKKLRLLGMG